ncbi:MAG: outer membrane lipoprotein carrier protein LolA [Candidatus Omnitrophota bacterium]
MKFPIRWGTFLLLGMLFAGGAQPQSWADEAKDPQVSVRSILTELDQKMGAIRTLTAQFVQEKELKIFQNKIMLKGTVAIQKTPMRFAWRVEAPMHYAIVMRGKKIFQWDEDTDKVRELSVFGSNAVDIIVEQIQKWFYGPYLQMLAEYQIRILSQDPVSLEFVPRESTIVSRVMTKITVTFQKDLRYIEQIQMDEKSGDRTLLMFKDTVLDAALEDKTWEAKPRE